MFGKNPTNLIFLTTVQCFFLNIFSFFYLIPMFADRISALMEN